MISPMAFPSVEQLTEIITPVAAAHGLDLEKVKVSRAGKKSLVAVAVDSDSRVNSDTLEVLSNELSALFDAKEDSGELNFGTGYTLEVGTPGTDMALTLPRHWRRNRGRLVTLVEDGKKSVWRIGALAPDEAQVVLVARQGKKLVVETAELAQHGDSMVEIEFAQPAADEMELVALSFEEAVERREDNNK